MGSKEAAWGMLMFWDDRVLELVVLIPKKLWRGWVGCVVLWGLEDLKDHGPINFLTSLYKLLAKVSVNKPKKMVGEVVS